MSTQAATRERPLPASAEQRLKELDIKLPAPPEAFGIYVEAVQTGNLLFVSGMLPTEGRGTRFIGRVGAELDVEAGRNAAHLAALNGLAVARQHLGSLDKSRGLSGWACQFHFFATLTSDLLGYAGKLLR
jgi:enamine deaminase RidA (YjgF/YER057c/UK114 family)